ncbi:MAG TPA: DUF2147 domain-containing protein [Ignavibacteria bacterium]|nr:DUF2147 domain-containing protein [Ignavibacteria bacterium]
MINFSNVTVKSVFKNTLTIIVLFISVSIVSAQSAEDDFSGNWKTEQGPLVQITKSGDTFKGVNIEHDKIVLENLKFEDGEWTGTLIKPKDGSRYNCTAVLSGNKLKITAKKGLLSRTLTWIKQ